MRIWLPHVWIKFRIRQWQERRICRQMRCSYYLGRNGSPHNLSHERFHMAERNLKNWEQIAQRHIAEGEAVPDYVSRMCWVYNRQVNS